MSCLRLPLFPVVLCRQEQEVQAAAESAATAGPWQRAMGAETENVAALVERHVRELDAMQVPPLSLSPRACMW